MTGLEQTATPAAVPSLANAFRVAAVDFYYQSIRLVPANLAWGAGLLAILASAIWLSPVVGLVAAPLLCLPLAGVFRLADQIVRGDDVVLSDVGSAIRTHGLASLAAGVAFVATTAVLATNLVSGIAAGSPLGLAMATLAGWGLVGTWVFALAFWVLLVDPARTTRPLTRARLAVLVVLAEPLRFGALGAALAVVTVVSAVAFAALLSVSVALAALVAARVVLPAADRFEQRVADRSATDPG